jgi:predicted nucleic acid-binding protein
MYLGVPRVSAKTIFGGLLRSRSPALYPHVAPETASTALDYATSYAIESWAGYLVSTALGFGARVVYSLDEELKRVREVTVVNPFSTKRTGEYHTILSSRARRGRKR